MERHIGIWYKEGHPKQKEVGELIIDGNSIEFYSRFHGEMFPCSFIGNDGEYDYKVFVNGPSYPKNAKSIDYSSSYRVLYVVMKNYQFSNTGITEFSFTIPELVNWLGVNTVSYGCTDSKEIAAYENSIPPITISDRNPKIELYYESKTFNSSILQDDRTSIVIKKEPRLKIVFDKPTEIQSVINEIECLMQFFGLLIGSVSYAEDIRLSIEGQKVNSWLYLNFDFSYNTRAIAVANRPRTYYYILKDDLSFYYANWRDFYFDDTYSLLRKVYFSVNDQKDYFAEDIFVQYMRILDGYHTRISGDAKIKENLEEALKASTKAIKKLLFTDDGKPLFEKAFMQADPNWKYNSDRKDDIAGWVASGYLARKQLSNRLQELDNMHLSIIRSNSVAVEKLCRDTKKIENKSDEELTQLYFRELGDTRNYYSHNKLDKSGVLEPIQLQNSINVLKAVIISIFLSHMKMGKELIRKIMAFDSELNFQTMYLRQDNDKPFQHPIEIDKDNSEDD